MNDLSALTSLNLLLRIRRDLFLNVDAQDALKTLPHVLEQCDRCGSRVSLYLIKFTGQEYLCVKCSDRF